MKKEKFVLATGCSIPSPYNANLESLFSDLKIKNINDNNIGANKEDVKVIKKLRIEFEELEKRDL